MTNWFIRFRGRLCLVAPLAALWIFAAIGVAQESTSGDAAASTPAPAADLPPGHSQHGEIFNEGPRQRAYLMGTTSNVSLSVTTKVPEAQQFFNQGLGQLHGFWYFEAERSFRQAAALDPECAMAYWGMAMANQENENRGKGFIDEAVKRKSQVSRREALWIDALAAFFAPSDSKDRDVERRRKYVKDLESIIHEFPDEVEAKAFLVVLIWQNANKGTTISSHQAVDSLISEVLAANPMHPVHHYRIHLWDYEKPARALGSAALCGQSAPGIAHMWHMPGHIFSRLERYGDAAWQQEASARVDHAHMMRDRVMPDQIHNYAHNNEWLIRDLEYVGRIRDAISLAKNLVELPRHPRYNTLAKQGSAQYGRERLFDLLARFELWDELIALAHTPYLEFTDIEEQQVKWLRALGTAYAAKGDTPNAQVQRTALTEKLTKVQAERDSAGAAAEAKAREEKKPDDQVAKAKEDAANPFKGRIEALERAMAEIDGRIALFAGDAAGALVQFEKAPGLDKEFLSHVHAKAGDAAKAEELAKKAVDDGKNRVYPLANLVEVLHAVGKPAESQEAFERLRLLAAQADLAAPIFDRLTVIAEQTGLPRDWRSPAVPAPDVGIRPNLDDLGPFRWSPSPALPWSLSDPLGNQLALAEFNGRPVVLIFYLGFGCLHCVEQLNAFAPMHQAYADAGIDVVAISSDTADALTSALADRQASSAPPLPFRILSNSDLSVFRDYRAFDDFEQKPLHGTFLIDATGLVRWQDISFEPFTDAQFLLNESKRLLGTALGAGG